MAKHNWTYKNVEEGFWVVCADCGTTDATYDTEDGAKRRVQQLTMMSQLYQAKTSKIFYPKTGMSRRMRKAKAAKRR